MSDCSGPLTPPTALPFRFVICRQDARPAFPGKQPLIHPIRMHTGTGRPLRAPHQCATLAGTLRMHPRTRMAGAWIREMMRDKVHQPLCLLILATLVSLLPACSGSPGGKGAGFWRNSATDRAVAARQAGDYVMALQFYEEIIRDQPANMQAHYALAQINQDLGRYEEAHRLYRIVYVSGEKRPALLSNGQRGTMPMFQAAEEQVLLLRARLGLDEAHRPTTSATPDR